MIKEITTKTQNIQDISNNLLEIVGEIPFWNSDYQNKQVVVWWQLTPERAYRHSAIRINNRLKALNECYYSLQETELDIELLEREIEELEIDKPKNYDLDIKRKELEIEKVRSNEPMTRKLIADAVAEVNSLLPIINSMWKVSKEQFELWEVEHFKQLHVNMLEWRNEHVLALENEANNYDLYESIKTKQLT